MPGRRPNRVRASLTAGLAVAVLGAALVVSVRPAATHPRITTTLLWQKDIAPILQRRCFSCHGPGNIAFSLATYAEARPWAAAIREEILTRRMPPWSAAPGYGHFVNDPALTQAEWDLVVAWVDGGAPSGQTLAEERTPPVYVPTDAAWDAGEPSLRLTMPDAIEVAAGAADSVQRIDMATPFTTPTRVHGLAFKPGDRRIVRYATVREAATDRWLFTWTPWSTSMHLPEGTAFVLPAGAKLRVEVGYRGTSEAASDRSEVGLYLDDASSGAVARPQTLVASASTLPAGAAPTRLRGELIVAEATALQALWPEPGPGATSVELTAYLPDGQVRPLVWLREPPAAWPAPYIYAEPVPLARGTRLVMSVYAANPTTAAVTVSPRLHLVGVPPAAATF